MICYTEINGIKVDSRIFTAKFCCDYEKCKGACCHQPIEEELSGGDLTDHEAARVLYYRKALSDLCDEGSKQIAERKPLTKIADTFYTTLDGHSKCVFCSMEKGTCVLKLVKGKISDIDIPISCQLYPIICEVTPTHKVLKIEDLFDKDYCVHAYEKGKRDNIFLLDFLEIPIIRGFGKEFYSKLKDMQKEFL